MKNRTLIIVALTLTAVMLFFVMLNNGNEQLQADLEEEASAKPAMDHQPSPWERILAVNDEIMDPETPISLAYQRYPITFLYFAVNDQPASIFSSPNDDRHIVRTAKPGEKLNYVETVILNGDGSAAEVWYHVYWYVNQRGELLADGSEVGAQKSFGFIPEGGATKRSFSIDAMAKLVKKAEQFASEGQISNLSNYKNGNGKPPQYKGTDQDAKGNRRSQSAPGYPDLTNKEEFTYLSDGLLVRILEADVGGYRKVLCLNDEKTYYVPMKYIPVQSSLSHLTKAVVIDRKNQNEAVFEKREEWKCVSYTMATTGTTSAYAAPTPLGYYLMLEKRPQFYYYKDGTTQVQGYAPYVMRFCGGAYVHGVPVSYQYKDGKRITPPMREYSATMGTIPLSHKCVRNYTSHAEFLYGWYEKGKTVVIVMEGE